jgi:hypothetical protein
MLDLAAAIKSNDLKSLKKWIQRRDGKIFFKYNVGRFDATLTLFEERSRTYTGMARLVLEAYANAAPNGVATPSLICDSKQKRLTFGFNPKSLLGALWLQLLENISTDSIISCNQCGRHMLLGPERNRRDKKFCSDACRQQAYRARRAEEENWHGSKKSKR